MLAQVVGHHAKSSVRHGAAYPAVSDMTLAHRVAENSADCRLAIGGKAVKVVPVGDSWLNTST
jgi:hypothetical protein